MDQRLILAFLLIAFGTIELIRGRFIKAAATTDDRVVEIFNTVTVPLLVVPGVFLIVFQLMNSLAPHLQGTWGQLPALAMIGILLVGDDMLQYWWHRLSHAVPLLFNFHRAHHEARYISIRVAYRNSFLYYALMPTIWVSALLIYLGLGPMYVGYAVVKMLVIFGAHCAVPWDAFLYRHKWLSPIAWVVERTISTPSTHWAHHGLDTADGVTNYHGNYGNLLFFWDVLFGTAKITRRYPTEFGVPGEQRPTFWRQLFFPLFRSWRTPRESLSAGSETPAI